MMTAVDLVAPPPGDCMTADLLLIAQLDASAFARFYDATAPRVLGLVRRLLIDPAQSEEVVQEIYLEVWQGASRFDPLRGAAMSWLMTVAHRRTVDRVRAAQASRDRDLRVGIRDLQRDHDHVSESVEVLLESERVARAMRRLTAVQREAVQLAYFEGLSHSEISDRLSVPVGTVKTRMRDGLMRLRAELTATLEPTGL